LYYNRARYLDPTTGRWTTQDPLGFAAGDANLYRYVGNTPTLLVDPSGNLAWFVAVPLVLGVGGFTWLTGSTALVSYRTTGSWWDAGTWGACWDGLRLGIQANVNGLASAARSLLTLGVWNEPWEVWAVDQVDRPYYNDAFLAARFGWEWLPTAVVGRLTQAAGQIGRWGRWMLGWDAGQNAVQAGRGGWDISQHGLTWTNGLQVVGSLLGLGGNYTTWRRLPAGGAEARTPPAPAASTPTSPAAAAEEAATGVAPGTGTVPTTGRIPLRVVEVRDATGRIVEVCFAAGTPILTPDRHRPIESVRVGDLVLSRPEHDPAGPVEAKVVEEVFVRTGQIWKVRAGGRTIETTGEHPFWVIDRGWESNPLWIPRRILQIPSQAAQKTAHWPPKSQLSPLPWLRSSTPGLSCLNRSGQASWRWSGRRAGSVYASTCLRNWQEPRRIGGCVDVDAVDTLRVLPERKSIRECDGNSREGRQNFFSPSEFSRQSGSGPGRAGQGRLGSLARRGDDY
jgi:hypothetical protein